MVDTALAVGCNKRSALHRMLAIHPAQCPLVIAPYRDGRSHKFQTACNTTLAIRLSPQAGKSLVIPDGEGANESLRKFHSNDAIIPDDRTLAVVGFGSGRR
jgi:hypothetical protein